MRFAWRPQGRVGVARAGQSLIAPGSTPGPPLTGCVASNLSLQKETEGLKTPSPPGSGKDPERKWKPLPRRTSYSRIAVTVKGFQTPQGTGSVKIWGEWSPAYFRQQNLRDS